MLKTKKFFYIVLITMIMMVAGCVGKDTTFVDQDNKALPEAFTNIYIFMDYSADFSDFVGNLTADLYNKGFITNQEKDKIGKIWKQHKEYNNRLQEEVQVWYNDIINGTNNLDSKMRILKIVENMATKSNEIFNLLMTKTEGNGGYMPTHLVSRMFELYDNVKENFNE